MQALIFNSGRGSRLGPLTADRPKALVPLTDGETLLARQLRLLAAAGVRDIILTTGYRSDQIIAATEPFAAQGLGFRFAHNPDYATSNAILSLHRAAPLLGEAPLLMLHGDLVFDAAWLAKVIAAPAPDLVATGATPPLNEKDFKARIREGRVAAIGVDLRGADCVNLMPFYRLSPRALRLWLDAVARCCACGETDIYAETAAASVLNEMALTPLSYAGHLLAEVDTPEDLAAVRARLSH